MIDQVDGSSKNKYQSPKKIIYSNMELDLSATLKSLNERDSPVDLGSTIGRIQIG